MHVNEFLNIESYESQFGIVIYEYSHIHVCVLNMITKILRRDKNKSTLIGTLE